ncbi:hypothetical protein MOBT1_003003 [Malassezia obtusa]|uniref:triacylglycerol lipase n=1 Tax=Malassezia obtusa TaxID=76774 RepID=A0AAF0E3D1_9BASI|nr:hypothetical protein MOBT1_003003 [Malassezia obtusa]
MRTLLFVLLALCARLVAGAAVAPLEPRSDVLSPENDPFYHAPSGWKNEEPGTVLRSRKITPTLATFDKVKVEHAYEILYRTTGTHESDPAVTATTVLVPYNAKRDKLVTYLTYVDADGSKCALSYSIRKGSDFPGDSAKDYQLLLAEQVLEAGYITTFPDHQGMNRAFGLGPLEGRQTLDGIKATLNYDKLNLKKHTPVVTTGYSGGAIASGWAAALHPSYAPSVNAKGFAMGGTPANLTGTLINLDGGLFSAFAIAGIAGVAYAYDDLLQWLSPRLTAKGRRAMEFARAHCASDTLLRYPFSKIISEDFVHGGTHILSEPEVYKVLNPLVMGLKKSLTPTAPVWMYHGVNDEVIPYKDAIKSADMWGQHGANVLFQTNTFPLQGHATTEMANVPNVLFFIEDRFADKPFPKGFNHEYIRSPLEQERVRQQGLKHLVEIIKNIIGDKIGEKNDSKLKAHIRSHAH